MTRLTAKDFPQELLDYYDYYAHGKITKREFLNLAARYAAGGVTALALFNMLKPNYALAEQVKFTDPDILPEYILCWNFGDEKITLHPTVMVKCGVIW